MFLPSVGFRYCASMLLYVILTFLHNQFYLHFGSVGKFVVIQMDRRRRSGFQIKN